MRPPLPQHFLIDRTLNRCFGSNDPDVVVFRRFQSSFDGGLNNTDDRDGDLFFQNIESKGGDRMAGDNEKLDVLIEEKLRILQGILDYGFPGP